MNINFERFLNTHNEYPGKIKILNKLFNAFTFRATGKCPAIVGIRIILQKGQRHFWSMKSETNASA